MMNRRQFVKAGVACGGIVASGSFAFGESKLEVPSYLRGYEELYASDPRKAALKYFREAKFGLFMHFVRPDLHFNDLARWSAKQGAIEVVLAAQITAIPFYERIGYVAEGGEFMDANIVHRMMRRPL